MPRVAPFDRPATYGDLEQLPPHVVAEIVDGELHASPRPAPRHAWASSRLGGKLDPQSAGGWGSSGGWMIVDEPELHLGPNVLVPDLAGWHRSRMPRLPTTAYFPVVPDWVCEVISPSTASLDREKKLAIYAREHVPHVWLVEPNTRTIEVLRLAGSRWLIVATHKGHDVVAMEPFDDVTFELRVLWGEDEDTVSTTL
jgi:Uma2 family endonuclease